MATLKDRRFIPSQQAELRGLADRLGQEGRNVNTKEIVPGQFKSDVNGVIGKDFSRADLVKDQFNQLKKSLEERVNIKEAGQKRRIRERKRTIFAGRNVSDNIFKRTLGGL